jgi:hypothetical protein
MTNTYITLQLFEFVTRKHIPDQTIALVQMNTVAFQRSDSRCILAPVLQYG